MASLRQRRKEQGLCIKCGNPRGEDGTADLCRPCAREHNSKQAKRLAKVRQRRRRLGLCVECGDPVKKVKGKKRSTLCTFHKHHKRKDQRRRRLQTGAYN